MPITFEQFECQFDNLQAAFSATKSAKIMELWFKEFDDLEHGPFVKAMHRCQYGERFPTWEKFKGEYENCLGPQDKSIDRPKCDYCTNGRVLFRDYIEEVRDVQDMAANCALCSSGRSQFMGNVDSRQLIKDAFSVLRTRRAVEHEKKAMTMRPNTTPANGREIAQAIFGKDDPVKEKVRRENLYKNREKEHVPF